MKVLIIEDDSLWAMKLQLIAERAGLEVITVVEDLENAKLCLEVETPDLIIADIYLSDGKIFSLYKNKKNLEIPSIFVTNSSNENDYKQAKRLKDFALLVKPFHQQTLTSTIELIIKKSASDKVKSEFAPLNERKINSLEIKRMYRLLGNDKIIQLFSLSDREKTILKKYWYELKSASVIGEELKISSQRVQWIYGKIIEKIRFKIANNAEQYKAYLKFISNRKNKLLLLVTDIEDVKHTDNTIISKINLKTNIDNLTGFSTKWVNVLREKNIRTIEDLLQYSKKELLLFRGVGPFVVWEIEKMLSNYGLKLKT